MSESREVTIELLDAIQDAFNRHDVPGILSYFSDECEWLMARGPEPLQARRLRGKAAIAEVLSARYKVIPDMRWEDMSHFVASDGRKACSEWTVRGTPNDGSPPLQLLGCDVWTFIDGQVVKKDTYWKFIG
ncbi:MAG: nuclear transport factor 2 family protein [Gammaproteobacteria bacterium]|nr:nuclear transport factor 2 family protein [Gammaproteobacteria bacterium]